MNYQGTNNNKVKKQTRSQKTDLTWLFIPYQQTFWLTFHLGFFSIFNLSTGNMIGAKRTRRGELDRGRKRRIPLFQLQAV